MRYRYYHLWRAVKGEHKKELKPCPRCSNNVHYYLAYDVVDFFFKIYAYKCPICPNFEPIPKELATAIIKGM
jgi:hypothetical protein